MKQGREQVQGEQLPRGIFRRGNILWIRYADTSGKIRREPGGATIRQAESKLKFRRGEKATGVMSETRADRLREKREQSKDTFGEWIDEAVEHHDRNSSEAHAYDFRRRCIYLREAFGKTPIMSMTRAAIADWMENASAGGVTGAEEWGAASWNRYHSCISSIFTLASERAVGDGKDPVMNPMSYIMRRSEDHKERYWSSDEESKIIKAIKENYPGTDYDAIFTLAIEVGYRKSEQLRSVVDDYNAETHKITVHQRKNKKAGPFRYVPLSDRGIAAYERLAKGKSSGEPLVVRKVKGKNLPMADVRQWFDSALIDVGITDEAATWHVCRHTFCSRLVAAGIPLPDVKEYAGHTDIRTTMRYTHGIEGVSDVRNLRAMNGIKPQPQQQPDVTALQKQIAELTSLVQQLTKK
jgi:integrase